MRLHRGHPALIPSGGGTTLAVDFSEGERGSPIICNDGPSNGSVYADMNLLYLASTEYQHV